MSSKTDQWVFFLQSYMVWCKEEDRVILEKIRAPKAELVLGPMGVAPNDNHGFITSLKELIAQRRDKKPVAVVLVSSGGFKYPKRGSLELRQYAKQQRIPFFLFDPDRIRKKAHPAPSRCPTGA